MKNFINNLKFYSTSFFVLFSIGAFVLLFSICAFADPQQEIKATAEADVDVFMIEEQDGSVTPIVIADASAKTEVKKTTRRSKIKVEAIATVDIHELKNIMPKCDGDVEKLMKTWCLFMSTPANPPMIESDACICTNRYAADSCVSVKWQYSVGRDYQIISKMWGFDNQRFIYCQENINWLTAEHHIMKSIVTNVMKASVDKLVAEPCIDRVDLVEYLDEIAYVILATDWETFMLCRTVDEVDSVTYVALTEEAYHRKDKTEIMAKVSEALKAHQVDETTMRTFTKTFNVQTNSIKPKKQGS